MAGAKELLRFCVVQALLLAPPGLCAQARLETGSFSNGLGLAVSGASKLESVVGEISGPALVSVSKKIIAGHCRTSHSPGVLYDMAATTATAGEGRIKINWTSVGRDGWEGMASIVELKVATYSITEDNYAAIISSLSIAALSTGTATQDFFSHLLPGPKYYAAARVRDSANLHGRLSPNVTFYTYAVPPDPVTSITVLSSTGGAVDLYWSVTGDDGSSGDINSGFFRIDYSSDPAHVFGNDSYMLQIGTSATSASQQYYSLSSLIGNLTYYAVVYIGDEVSVYSGLGQIAQMMTMAYPPSISGFFNVSSASFTADLSANNAQGAQYYVQISTAQNFAPAMSSGWTQSVSLNFGGLETNTTYYIRGKSRNSAGVETVYADMGAIYLNLDSGLIKPRTPMATGALSAGIYALSWPVVDHDTSGSTITLKNYEIYKTTSATGTASLLAVISSAALSYSVPGAPAYWYCVKALDSNNVRGECSAWLKSSGDMARVAASDKRAVVDMSAAAGAIFNSQGLLPVIEVQPQYETGATLAAYKIYLLDRNNNALENRDLGANVTLVLPLSKNSPVTISAVSPAASYSPYDYAVYYFNGVEDVKIGGNVDPAAGTITVTTGKTGVFKVKQVIRPQNFRITQTVPRKIFTPNGDGIWDEFNIIYEDPEGGGVSSAKVYDIKGAEIAGLKKGKYNSEESLSWDGKLSGGGKAEAGIYIYQFKAGGEWYNGTIVLAR